MRLRVCVVLLGALVGVLPTLGWAECTSAQIFTELSTDPQTLGYATAYGQPITQNSSGNDQAVLEVINLIRQGAAYQIQRTLVPAYEVAAQMDPAEFNALTSVKQQQLVALYAPLQVDLSSTRIRDILFNGTTPIFPNPGATKNNIQAIVKRPGSRAEVLCGRMLTLADISLAIRNTQ
jgi:hypothetical protein